MMMMMMMVVVVVVMILHQSARDCDAIFIRKFAGYKFLIIGRQVPII
jgi:hypothetical protein